MNDIRYYIDLIEGITGKRNYVGNCVNSFDLDGECIIDELPFMNVSDLGYVDENASEISGDEFMNVVNVPDWLLDKISDNEVYYMVYNDLYILYDSDLDIHYFFI